MKQTKYIGFMPKLKILTFRKIYVKIIKCKFYNADNLWQNILVYRADSDVGSRIILVCRTLSGLESSSSSYNDYNSRIASGGGTQYILKKLAAFVTKNV